MRSPFAAAQSFFSAVVLSKRHVGSGNKIVIAVNYDHQEKEERKGEQ